MPVFISAMLVEAGISHRKQLNVYNLRDTGTSLCMLVLSAIVEFFPKIAAVFVFSSYTNLARLKILLIVNGGLGERVHTDLIERCPRLIEFVFNTPSHHRVHHASNVRYLDCNHAGVLITWDRLFGTFSEQVKQEPPVYGLT